MISINIRNGFTLIEMMITVAIIAILASIAFPSYQSSILKSRRADAKSVLLQAANWMERYYAINHRYDQDINGVSVTSSSATTAFPQSGFTKSPMNSSTYYYDISLSNVTQTTFTLTATPVSTTNQIKDACKNLTLNQAGTKSVAGGATLTADQCW